jgi:dephospho-CoA kinase
MRVAITGGIAEGKSTVLSMVSELGYPTASADVIAREVFEDPEVQAALGEAANLSPPIDRGLLRARIAESPDLRRAVNAITHPRIVQRMDASPAGFFEIPLVIETCRYLDFDEIWVVTCGPEEQRRRLVERIDDPVQVERLIAAQIDTRAKLAFADRVFRTNLSLETVRQLVSEATASISFS